MAAEIEIVWNPGPEMGPEISGKTFRSTRIFRVDENKRHHPIDSEEGDLRIDFGVIQVGKKKMNLIARVQGKPELEAQVAPAIAAARAEREAQRARLAAIAAIPGLAALREHNDAVEQYERGFARMMESEHNDGVRPPKQPPELPPGDYTVARLYLEAEWAAASANYAKSGNARRAIDMIIEGRSPAEIRAHMDSWIDSVYID